ncbi:MAG: substrate-binding domain-containing protein [Campylobacterales bacterium]
MRKIDIIKMILLVVLSFSLLEAKEYKVGFAQDTLANDWRKAQVDEFVNHAKKYDFLKVDVKDAQSSVAKQLLHIEEFIREDYDFIVTSPINAQITSQVLKKALDKDIKVILLSRGVADDSYTTFIRPDNKKIAKEAAEFLLEKMDYKGSVLMLQGVAGATSTIQREEGFEEVAKNYPNIDIIKARGNYLRNDAIKVVEELYAKGIRFDAIYAHSEGMISGAKAVMDKHQDNRDIPIVGIDYIQEAKEAILRGDQLASFTYPTSSKEGVEAIVDIIEGKSVPKDIIIDTLMVDKKNVSKIKPIF